MNKGLWYFAHPYTCKDAQGAYVSEAEDANFNLCNYRAGQLILRGYNIYSPISHTHPIHKATPAFLMLHEHDLWYKLDLQFLENCNFTGLILAPFWECSKGCNLERDFFVKQDKPILLYHNIVDYKTAS